MRKLVKTMVIGFIAVSANSVLAEDAATYSGQYNGPLLGSMVSTVNGRVMDLKLQPVQTPGKPNHSAFAAITELGLMELSFDGKCFSGNGEVFSPTLQQLMLYSIATDSCAYDSGSFSANYKVTVFGTDKVMDLGKVVLDRN